MADAQQQVQRILDHLVQSGAEYGIQVAAYHEGRLVVSAWAGTANRRTGKPVDGLTLFPAFSCAKGVAATVIHRLRERGLLDYDRPLAADWPGFGRHGKERITLRQVLTHTAGLAHMPDGTVDDLCDWNAMCRKLANETPLWEPGTHGFYHAITYGWLVGEPACRVTGKTFSELVQEEVAQPLGRENDLFIGLPDSAWERVAWLEDDAPMQPGVGDPISTRSIPSWLRPLTEYFNRPEVYRACVPASNGIMTAEALARHYAALLDDGADGIRLITSQARQAATTPHRTTTPPETGGTPFCWGLGYGLQGPQENPTERFGHGGYGGTTAFADIRRRLAVAIFKNRLNAPVPEEGCATDQILRAIASALKLD